MANHQTKKTGGNPPNPERSCQKLRHQQDILKRLLDRDVRSLRNSISALRALMRSVGELFSVTRGGVWKMRKDGRMVAQVLMESGVPMSACGLDYDPRVCPVYAKKLSQGKPIAIADVGSDRRILPWLEGYFRPLKIGSLLDIPILEKGRLVGSLCFEHVGKPRVWEESEVLFAETLGRLVAQWWRDATYGNQFERVKGIESHQRCVLDSLPDHIALLDNRGTIKWTNEAWRRFGKDNGLAEDLLAGELNYLEVCETSAKRGDAVAEEINRKLRRVLAGELNAFSLEYPCHAPDEKRWFEVRVLRCRESRAWSQVVVIHNNITKRVHAQLKTRQTEAHFETVVNTCPFGIQVSDLKGRIGLSNPAHHAILGCEDGKLVGKYVWEFGANETIRSQTKADYQMIIRDQPEPFPYQNSNKGADGREIELEINWNYLRNDEGELTGIVSILSDITELKKAQRNLIEDLEFATLVSRVSSEFIHLPVEEFDGKIKTFFESLGLSLGLERIFFAECSEDGLIVNVRLEWKHPDLRRKGGMPKRIETKNFRWWRRKWCRGEPVVISRMTDLPKAASAERSLLTSLGVQSHLNFPIMVDGKPACLLGFQCIRREIDWMPDLFNRLKLVSEIIGNAAARMQIEENLRQTEERLRLAFNQQFQFVAILTPDWRVMDINDGPIWLSETSREDFVGRRLWELPIWKHLPDWAELLHAHVMTALSLNEPLLAVDSFQTRDGEDKHVKVSCQVIRNADGSPRFILVEAIDITDLKHTDEALRQSNERLNHAQRIARMGDFILDLKSNSATWSEGLYNLLGYARSENLDYDWIRNNVRHPEDRDRIKQWLDRNIRSKSNFLKPNTFRLIRRDGSFITVHVEGIIQREEGRATRIVGIVQDISEIRAMEQSLQQSEQRFRAIYNHAPVCIAVIDAEGRPQQTNRELQSLLGYTDQELCGMTFLDYTHEQDRSISKKRLSELVRGKQDVLQWEKRFVNKRGKPVWVYFSAVAVRSKEGGLEYMITTATDFTQRKLAEENLRVSEERFQRFMQELPASVYIKDESLRFVYSNGYSITDLSRVPPDALVGQSAADFFVPQVAKRLERMDRKVLRTLSLVEHEGEVESLDREKKWIHDIKFPITGPRGEVWVGGICLDISAKKEAERQMREARDNLEHIVEQRTLELKQALEKAESADRLKSIFISTMSHELRTPLNSVIGFTGLLLQGMTGPLNPEQEKQLRIIQQSSRHLLAIINDVLDISRIEAGQLEIRPAVFDAEASIRKVADILSTQAEAKGLDFYVEVEQETGEIFTDQKRFEQIIMNLAGNAIKFTPEGRVCIEAGIEEGQVVIRVKDTGIGIRSEDMRKLFKPFQQIDIGSNHRQEGTGLGLVISRRLAELLGGRVTAISTWGEGSVFTLAIPQKVKT